jgi:hypothetical protein
MDLTLLERLSPSSKVVAMLGEAVVSLVVAVSLRAVIVMDPWTQRGKIEMSGLRRLRTPPPTSTSMISRQHLQVRGTTLVSIGLRHSPISS